MTHGKRKLRRCRECGSERMRSAGKCKLIIGHATEQCTGMMQVVKDDRR